MSQDDVLFGFRLRLFTLAEELGNVSEACRLMGVHRSSYYRWKRQVDRWGLEALRVRERRRPRQPNEIGPHLEQRIVAFSLAHPGFGPRRIAAELRREKWGGIRISEHGVWRVLRRVGSTPAPGGWRSWRATATPTSAAPRRRSGRTTSRPSGRASSCRRSPWCPEGGR